MVLEKFEAYFHVMGIHICDCRMIGQNEYYLGKVQAGTSAEDHIYYDCRGSENNSNKSAGDVLGSAITWNGVGVCLIDGSIPPTNAKSEKLRNRA